MEKNMCIGVVESLSGEKVLFTGKAVVNGEHVARDVLRAFARQLGAVVAPDQSRSVTLLVHGDTWTGPLHDEVRRYSKKAAFVEEVERTRGHVHVIDAVGFGELMAGRSARCFELRKPAS